MIPVLAVEEPAAAREDLIDAFGFVPAEDGMVIYGSQEIAICRTDDVPAGLLAMRFDHVAFSAPDIDAVCATNLARGACLSSTFTPDGPREIPTFWESGVRFVFFDGPEGWPFEFCARHGTQNPQGHSHFAIRTGQVDQSEALLRQMGAVTVARHVLEGGAAPVNVSFLELAGHVFEVFDEAPLPKADAVGGWIGLLQANGS